MHSRGILLVFLATQLILSQETCYDFVREKQKIISPGNSVNNKYFGNSVVLSNNGYLVVGAKYDAENGLNAGAAHVYKNVNGNWFYEEKLLPSRGGAYKEFGTSLAMDGNVLVVGSPRDNINGADSGSIYIFELQNGTWVETSALQPSDGRKNSLFGQHIGISKNTIVVNSNTDVGSLAYVFKLKPGKWHEKKKLRVSDKRGFVPYGHPVAIHGNRLVVGRWYDNKNGHQSGSAVIFRKVGGKWIKDGALRPSDGSHADWFGISVAISNRFVVVSSHGDDVNGTDGSGSAYVFEKIRGNWTETAKLLPRNGKTGDSFGYPLAIRKDKIIIGCMGYDSENPDHNSGGVYVFQNLHGNWTQQYKLLPSDGEYNGRFGYSLALDDKHVAVAGINYEEKTGSVYMFENLNVFNNSAVLCERAPAPQVGVNYRLILAVVIPLAVIVLILVFVVVYRLKCNIEKGEDEAGFIYQDVPKSDEAVS